ncbi:MAG: hypothetical protein PUP92_25165, partial [Rhizonema sp. PD38]|nr:hypothetical protein [Rhizonema sp. PD38]
IIFDTYLYVFDYIPPQSPYKCKFRHTSRHREYLGVTFSSRCLRAAFLYLGSNISRRLQI